MRARPLILEAGQGLLAQTTVSKSIMQDAIPSPTNKAPLACDRPQLPQAACLHNPDE